MKIKVQGLKICLFIFICFAVFNAKAQNKLPEKVEPQGSDLLHTRLALEFDWEKRQVLGLANLSFTPYSLPQNTLTLDAKGFEIDYINLRQNQEETPLPYQYNGTQISITLDKTYAPKDTFELVIAYVASPDKYTDRKQGKAIEDEKGLYFINPDGKIPYTPRQIWTQGETESNSVWFPTLEKTYERCTQEMYITVDSNFVTLSNGEFVYSRDNGDGTRTDYWKMDLPHAPYLFMLAVGEFAIIKDTWQGKEVNYYVEPQFAASARAIFGKTPKMLSFFSDKLQYPYPWQKYSQVVVRNFVSGAMENTTASVFYDYIQTDERALLDEHHESIIAHELFHQWFGNLVTCQSWAELVLNEGFADYAEYLWAEYEHSKEEADYIAWLSYAGYLDEHQENPASIIRPVYEDPDDLFDAHSYNKGGLVLHTLHFMLGDGVFWKALNLYLSKNAFQAVAMRDLQAAFEEASGQPLQWFFEQWYLQPGHPMLQTTHTYKAQDKMTYLRITQQQAENLNYKLLLPVAYWQGGVRKDTLLWLTERTQTFALPTEKPLQTLIINEGNDVLAVIDHEKTKEEWLFQLALSQRFPAQLRALFHFEDLKDEKVRQLYLTAFRHHFWVMREQAIYAFEDYKGKDADKIAEALVAVLQRDTVSRVRMAALEVLTTLPQAAKYQSFYRDFATKDRSYGVIAAALRAYWKTQGKNTLALMAQHESTQGYEVAQVLVAFYFENKLYEKAQWIDTKIALSEQWNDYTLILEYANFLKKCPTQAQQKGIQTLLNIARYSGTDWHKSTARQALEDWKQIKEVADFLKD